RPSLVRRGVLVGDVGPRGDLWTVAVVPADRASEFFESFAEGAARLGQAFGPEEEESDNQDDDQMRGLQDSGEHGRVLSLGRISRGSRDEPRLIRVVGWRRC